MRMRNLSYLNDFYNMQDATLLCNIFGNSTMEMMKEFPYNTGKCFHRFSDAFICFYRRP